MNRVIAVLLRGGVDLVHHEARSGAAGRRRGLYVDLGADPRSRCQSAATGASSGRTRSSVAASSTLNLRLRVIRPAWRRPSATSSAARTMALWPVILTLV